MAPELCVAFAVIRRCVPLLWWSTLESGIEIDTFVSKLRFVWKRMEAYGSVWIRMDPYQESVWDFIHPQLGLWWSDELGELCVVLPVIHRCVPV